MMRALRTANCLCRFQFCVLHYADGKSRNDDDDDDYACEREREHECECESVCVRAYARARARATKVNHVICIIFFYSDSIY